MLSQLNLQAEQVCVILRFQGIHHDAQIFSFK